MKNPGFRIALIADVHVGAESAYEDGHIRKLSRHSLDFLAALAREFECEKGAASPDLVVQLGDLIEDCPEKSIDVANYAKAIDAFGCMGVPTLHVIGNHEQVNLDCDELCQLNGMPAPYFSRDIGDFHCVVLFTASTGHTDIHIDEAQQEWLKNDLSATDKVTLVFVHHPLDEQNLAGNPWFERYPDYCFVEERQAVRRILSQSGKVAAVFNGHVHQNACSLIDGIAYITIQSLVEKVAEPAVPARAFALAEIGDGRLDVRIFGQDPGEYRLDLPALAKAR